VLNAQGRIQGDLTVWRDSDDLELEIAADQYDRLIAHLDHFIIMDDVELAGVNPAEETALGLTGPKADEILGRVGLPILTEPLTQAQADFEGTPVLLRRGYGALAEHYSIWIPAAKAGVLWQALSAAGAKPVGFAALEAFRIAEGIPAYGVDMVERDLPQETSQMRALHFSKGCYLGQEIVERIRSRGNVHRHLRSLELEGPLPGPLPEPGTKLTVDGLEAGHITSVAELPLPGGARIVALGMIRADAEQRNVPLTYAAGEKTGSARVVPGAPQL
jgi:folate-binding protein YgfZ